MRYLIASFNFKIDSKMNILILRACYGRKITSQKHAKQLWEGDKDFQIQNIVGGKAGQKINKLDFRKYKKSDPFLKSMSYIHIRYANNTKVAAFKVKDNEEELV